MEHHVQMTRRRFFGDVGLRMGGVALGLLSAGRDGRLMGAGAALGSPVGPADRVHPPLPGLPHFAPKARAIIYLHMNGGPTQLDTWDHKPGLLGYFDKNLPDSVRMGQRLSTMTSGQDRFPVAPSRFAFRQHGKCGTWVNPSGSSWLLPSRPARGKTGPWCPSCAPRMPNWNF